MKIYDTTLTDVKIIEVEAFGDHRGYFQESYNLNRYKSSGIKLNFVQDNQSYSKKNILRGLHFQINKPQGKLVSVVKGSIYDVVADINPQSKNYGKYFGIELSDQNHLQLWIPPGYAHGFCVLSEDAYFQYKCTDFYDSSDEGGVKWDDPKLNIKWPISNPIVSEKDNLLSYL